MKIIALHLTNVRKFAAKRASITGISSGITVVSEANEFGKSTFFDAVHALFFEKYSSSAKPVKSLSPYSGGGVEVAADVETSDGVFRVEKRFLSKKSAKITRASDGAVLAQDDEAERWISQLLGTASDGPAGLLWVRQGQLDLEAETAKEKSLLMETRRDLLSSVAGEIDTMTGGRRMDRVMRQVSDNLLAIATKTGRKTGAWKAASDQVDLIEAELMQVAAQVKTLDTALKDRKVAEVAAKRLDNPDAKARRDNAFSAARAAMDIAHAHIGAVNSAQQSCDLAQLKAAAAVADLDAFLMAIDTLGSAQTAAAHSNTLALDAQGEADHLKEAAISAQSQHNLALDVVTKARTALDLAGKQTTARMAQSQSIQIADRIEKAELAQAERDASNAVTSASVATAAWVQMVQTAQAEVSKLMAIALGQSTTVQVTYETDARIIHNGRDFPGDQPVVLDAETELRLPGLGRMTIHTKAVGSADKEQLTQARATLKNVLEQAGVTTLQDAHTLAAARTDAATKANLAQAVLDTLAPDGIDALRMSKAKVDLAAVAADDAVLPSLPNLEAAMNAAQETLDVSEKQAQAALVQQGVAREMVAKRRATAEATQQSADRAEIAAGPVETRDARRADLLRLQAQAQANVAQATIELQAVKAAAPDLETAAAELKRSEAAVTAARDERAGLNERLAALSSEIRTLAGHGIEERRDELIGELATARASETKYADQAAALSRLQSALDEKRRAARDTYFEPVQAELKPLLSILHDNAVLSFDSDSLLPNGLMRDNGQETLGDLSGGTKEQIAILTRLAFARLFARQGRHMPIILDDALVYSDDDRIVKMFTALTRVAQDQQIIVFSCRQLAFQDLGGARPKVEICDI